MRILFLFFLLTAPLAQSQSIVSKMERNKNLSSYTKVKIISFYGKYEKRSWSKKLKIKDGKIAEARVFNKGRLFFKAKYLETKKGYKVVLFDRIDNKVHDTLQFWYDYDIKGEEIQQIGAITKKTSNFNAQNLPQTVEYGTTAFDSLFGYKEAFKYDTYGNIIERKIYSKHEDQDIISTITFTYDRYNNVIELNRSSSPEQEYPIIVLGGLPHYQNEKFRYVYNKDNFWVEKYWIAVGTETLVQKRKFK